MSENLWYSDAFRGYRKRQGAGYELTFRQFQLVSPVPFSPPSATFVCDFRMLCRILMKRSPEPTKFPQKHIYIKIRYIKMSWKCCIWARVNDSF